MITPFLATVTYSASDFIASVVTMGDSHKINCSISSLPAVWSQCPNLFVSTNGGQYIDKCVFPGKSISMWYP